MLRERAAAAHLRSRRPPRELLPITVVDPTGSCTVSATTLCPMLLALTGGKELTQT